MPEPLPRTFWGWIPRVLRYTQDDVVELAGYDAAMYLRILGFGMVSCCTYWHSQLDYSCNQYHN